MENGKKGRYEELAKECREYPPYIEAKSSHRRDYETYRSLESWIESRVFLILNRRFGIIGWNSRHNLYESTTRQWSIGHRRVRTE